MDYYKVQITTSSDISDILTALLSQHPFDTFEEIETGFNAYIPVSSWTTDIAEYLTNLQERFDFQFEKHFIKHQNWNAVWEANFQPLSIGNFCGVRANFHPSMPQVRHEIVIDPKMAFGTGHHETTYMMMFLMGDIPFEKTKVLDYGCGTGILAILAAQLGATMVDAVDIDILSYENTIENAQLNNIFSINALHGTIEAVLDADYQIILANINRHVILNTLSTLYHKLRKGGILLLSGILKSDESLLREHIQKHPFTIDEVIQKGEWIAIKIKK